jgi:hypothetical protein
VGAEVITQTDDTAHRSHCTVEASDLDQAQLAQTWQRPISTDAIVPLRRSLKRLGIRELRLMARDRGLKSYSQFTKPQLLEYLQA